MADLRREFTTDQYEAMRPDLEEARAAVLAALARHHELGLTQWVRQDADSVPDPAVKEAFSLLNQAARLIDRAQFELVLRLRTTGAIAPKNGPTREATNGNHSP